MATEDFKEKLKLLGEEVKKDYSKCYSKPFCRVIEHNGVRMGLIAVETVDRDCDASVEDLHFYILREGQEKPEKVFTRHPKYDKSYKFSERFFSVGAKKEISDELREEDGKLIIPVKLTIEGGFNLGNPFYKNYKTLAEDEFEISYELNKSGD